jgi:hypothetical protein
MDTSKLIGQNWKAAYAHIGSLLLVVALFYHYGSARKHATAQTFRYAIPIPNAPLLGHNPIGGTSCNSNNSASAGQGQCNTEAVFAPPTKTFSFNVIYGTLAFFAITAFAHIYYATDALGSGKYSSYIAQGWNPYRWAEYAVSASIMTVLIAYELGIKDSNHLLSLVFMNVALQACGYLVEHALIQPRIDTTTVKGATAVGWFLLAGMWIPILASFYYIYKDIKDNYKGIVEPSNAPNPGQPVKIPGFVWFIVIVQLLNFASFGFIQLGQVRNALSGNPKPFSVYEKRYLFLSFAGKLGLAGGLAYGLIFRTRKC